ncbi:MAG TPA: rhomboid family intramembrane serine protease [Candidatus Limnocylindria bacterium]|nr:rhomboid family intramembrane serine protease [Candidatus Limnocylindria bacterium]
MQPIRVAPTAAQADEWSLVLTAAGIPHAIAQDDRGWHLLVVADDAVQADASLAAYDREAAERLPTTAPAEAPPYPWMSGVTVALLLLVVFSLTGPPAAGSRWFERGAAVAARILGDEPWRAVTALTLHADTVHVLGNAVATAVLLPPLVQRVGLGVALCLMLLAGAGGNVLAALVHDPRHIAIGASTATFGVIGALAALRVLPSAGTRARRGWVVLAATLVLLAMLGTAPEADVIAHALGLVAGGVLGLATGALLQRPPAAAAQSVLGALAALVMAGAWALAVA